MAVGKEAPIPSVAIVGIAQRKAFEAVVEEFTETLASLPTAIIKRRLKGATITMPHGLANGQETIECKTEVKSIAAAASEELL